MRELRTLSLHLIFGISSSLAITACGPDINVEPPVNPADYVVAQFDPTNPIPPLALVPTPTALAQKPDGSLNVTVSECELGTIKQCAPFSPGWGLTDPVTLFFSGEVDPASITPASIKFWKLSLDGSAPPAPVEYTVVTSSAGINQPRPTPPEACKTQFGYDDSKIPAGVQVQLVPSAPLEAGAAYAVYVESSEDGGIRALEAPNEVVQPSSLFSLMNVPPAQAPVCLFDTSSSTTSPTLIDTRLECTGAEDPSKVIIAPLVRSQLQGGFIVANFGKEATYQSITDEQRAQVDAYVAGSAPTIAGLYGYFNRFIEPFSQAGAIDRSNLVFATLWTTARLPSANLVFDPENSEVPFPNTQVLTLPDETSSTGVRVNLPVPTTPGVEQLLISNLNTLDGFGLLATMTVSVAGEIDLNTIADAVVVYELDASGAPVGDKLSVIAVMTSTPTAAGYRQIVIRSRGPLKQKTQYVVGITNALKAAGGGRVGISATYDILKNTPVPVVDDDGTAADFIKPILECSTVPTTGMLANEAQVNGLANALENQLFRARWQEAFEALEQATPAIPRANVIMAWTYTTQNVTDAVDFANSLIGPAGWEMALGPAGIPRLEPVDLNPDPNEIGIIGSSSIADFLGVVDQFCVGLLCGGGVIDNPECGNAQACLVGQITDPNICDPARAAIEGEQFCQVAVNLLTGSLGELRRYNVALYKVISGNPLNPTEGPFDPDRFAAPLVQQTSIWVALPAAAAPNDGYPVTIFQHGLTREKEDGFFIANSLAQAGQATILMDALWHGERTTDIVNNTTGAPCVGGPANLPNIDPDGVVCAADGTCTGGCDDLQDSSGTGAITVSPFTIRDGLRQATIDHLTLLRAVEAERDPATGLGDLDPSIISYAGQSLGGIAGANLLPYVPGLNAAALNVAGGGIVNIVHLNPTFAGALNGALAQAGVCDLINPNNPAEGCQPTAAYLQFLSVTQWVVEPGDPLGTSVGVTSDRTLGGTITVPAFGNDRILMQKAIPDPVVPNPATEALGGVYGFNPADNSPTSHFQTYAIGGAASCHGFLLLPDATQCGLEDVGGNTAFENALCATLGAQKQIARFISSGGTTVGPRVTDVIPGILACPNDFDIQ